MTVTVATRVIFKFGRSLRLITSPVSCRLVWIHRLLTVSLSAVGYLRVTCTTT